MAQQRPFKVLSALTTTVVNLLNANITSLSGPVGVTLTQPRLILAHIRVINKSTGAVTCSFYVGATGASAAGTEFNIANNSVPAQSYIDWYGKFEMDSTDFLTGNSGANTALVANIEFEAGFA